MGVDYLTCKDGFLCPGVYWIRSSCRGGEQICSFMAQWTIDSVTSVVRQTERCMVPEAFPGLCSPTSFPLHYLCSGLKVLLHDTGHYTQNKNEVRQLENWTCHQTAMAVFSDVGGGGCFWLASSIRANVNTVMVDWSWEEVCCACGERYSQISLDGFFLLWGLLLCGVSVRIIWVVSAVHGCHFGGWRQLKCHGRVYTNQAPNPCHISAYSCETYKKSYLPALHFSSLLCNAGKIMQARQALQNKSPWSGVVWEVSSSSSLVFLFFLTLHPAANEKAAYLNTMADMASGFTCNQMEVTHSSVFTCCQCVRLRCNTWDVWLFKINKMSPVSPYFVE